MKRILKHFIELGTRPQNDPKHNQIIRLINKICLFVILVISPYMLLTLYFNSALATLMQLGAILALGLTVFLNSRQFFDLARVLTLLIGNFHIFNMVLILGLESGIYFYFSAAIIAPLFFYTSNELKSILFFPALTTALALFVHFLGGRIEPVVETPAVLLDFFFYFSVFGSLITGFIFVSYFYNESNRYEKRLKEANSAKSEFWANMSHELRTPLNAILGFSELMSRDRRLSSEQLGYLETIGRSGEHLLSLINDVLEFSKIEAGRIVLNPENFDLHRLLLGLEEMFCLRARQKGLSLEFDRCAEVPRFIRSDQGKLRQILINLLGNAVKFTEAGGIVLRVTCDEPSRKMQRNGTCSLNFGVIDTGVGIDPEEQEKVFDVFFQAGGLQPSHQGTGLGLPISRKFVSMMGGALKVHSEPGGQTTFSFAIPVELADGADSSSSHLTRRVTGLEAGQPVFRLLVVEDNENNRNLLVKLLQTVGFAVQEAANGQEAVKIWEEWRPHLIWMDMRMPVMNGYQATTHIKGSPGGKDTVIIALTASAFEEDRQMVLEHGCNDFVRKPFKENDILEKLHQFLGVRYLHEDTTLRTLKSEDAGRVTLTRELLMELPAELRLELMNAVDVVDFGETTGVIEKIRAQNEAMADALTDLVNQYRFDTLQELLEGNES